MVEPNSVAVVYKPIMKDTQALVAPQADELLFLGDEVRTSLKHALPRKGYAAGREKATFRGVQVGLFSRNNKRSTRVEASHLKHLGQISQVERVVALGWCWQQVVGDCVVDVKRSRHHVGSNLPIHFAVTVVTFLISQSGAGIEPA